MVMILLQQINLELVEVYFTVILISKIIPQKAWFFLRHHLKVDAICNYLMEDKDQIEKLFQDCTLVGNTKLKKYFEYIKEKVTKIEIKDVKKYDTLYKKRICDYIMNKIYEKILK